MRRLVLKVLCFSQGLVDRLHSVLRPFLLRRLKSEVEKQMPGKHEHVIKCRLSKRQRTLYEDYMASSETRTMLSSGNFLGIINVLMQLRKASGCRPLAFPLHHGPCQTLHKWLELQSHMQPLLIQYDIESEHSLDAACTYDAAASLCLTQCLDLQVCNHPDLFEGRPIISAFDSAGIEVQLPSPAMKALKDGVWKGVNLGNLNLVPAEFEGLSQWEAATVQVRAELVLCGCI